jgi:predicted 3-demethylubiquinone-9 3-methyltransferase (glyoxalase superfamily)
VVVPANSGWYTDRFGESRQVAPRRLREVMVTPNRNAAWRAMLVMLEMD